ncbi:hypothetical protein IAR55_002198 [Kwoniella newhampshirensis]|uniref:Restriction of telomere capping protein 4 n=1 Tax=Kwoniella newhampshirensis TaxID=1651941 RepID=A0AAW0Z0U0_9TREE
MEGMISRHVAPSSSPQSIFFQQPKSGSTISQSPLKGPRRPTVAKGKVIVRDGDRKAVKSLKTRELSRTPSCPTVVEGKELLALGAGGKDKGKEQTIEKEKSKLDGNTHQFNGPSLKVLNGTGRHKSDRQNAKEVSSRKGKEKERNPTAGSFFISLTKTRDDLDATYDHLNHANNNGRTKSSILVRDEGKENLPKLVKRNSSPSKRPSDGVLPFAQQANPTATLNQPKKNKAKKTRSPVITGSYSRAPKLSYPDIDSDSDSPDELSLGSTPPRHKHLIYDDRGSLPPPPSPPLPAGIAASQRNGKTKKKTKRDEVNYIRSSSPLSESGTSQNARMRTQGVLVPASEEDLFLLTPRVKNTKRSSEEMSTDPQEEERNVKKGKKRDMTTGRGARTSFTDSQGQDKNDETSRPKLKTTKSKEARSQQESASTIQTKPQVTLSLQRRRRRIMSEAESDAEAELKKPATSEKGKAMSQGTKSAGHSFFQQLPTLSSDRDEFDYGILDESADITAVIEEGFDDENGLSEEEKDYLVRFSNANDLCPYCSQPLPTEPSSHLIRLRLKLEAISRPRPTAENANARQLAWQQYIDFCSLHHAESTIIPLGIKSGYPERIHFVNLEDRLEKGWVRQELYKMIENPQRSRLFREVKEEVKRVGRMRWGGIGHQSKEERLAAVKAGYFGELGRIVMTDHFQRMRNRGLLQPSIPPARSSSSHNPVAIHPLTANDFITTILVPEAAILLIMSDQGVDSFDEEAYLRAAEIRAKSATYGEWKFRTDDEAAQDILEKIRNREGDRQEYGYGIEKSGSKRSILKEVGTEVEDDEDDEDKENKEPFTVRLAQKATVDRGDRQGSMSASNESIVFLDTTPITTPSFKTMVQTRRERSSIAEVQNDNGKATTISKSAAQSNGEYQSEREPEALPVSSQRSISSFGDGWNDDQWAIVVQEVDQTVNGQDII